MQSPKYTDYKLKQRADCFKCINDCLDYCIKCLQSQRKGLWFLLWLRWHKQLVFSQSSGYFNKQPFLYEFSEDFSLHEVSFARFSIRKLLVKFWVAGQRNFTVTFCGFFKHCNAVFSLFVQSFGWAALYFRRTASLGQLDFSLGSVLVEYLQNRLLLLVKVDDVVNFGCVNRRSTTLSF